MDRKQTGKLGENIAAKYLRKKNYKILARNWQNKWGEIDIVASPPHQNKNWFCRFCRWKRPVLVWCGDKHKERVVFVEVKTLQNAQNFLPEDEINQKKKRQLIKMAQIYLLQNKIPLETPHQIDVIAIKLTNGKPKIRHLENVLEDII